MTSENDLVAILEKTALLSARQFERFPSAFGGQYRHTNHEWRFPNGSVLEFCYAAGEAAPWRSDQVRPSLPEEKALGNAPSKVGTSFAVPKIIE